MKETTSSKITWKGKEAEVKTEYGWYTSPHLWEQLKPLARKMRRAPTSSEDRLWQRLRNHQLRGFKFRRQHTIDRFIVDFYCSNVRLVIEVDGPVHQYTPEEDVIRQAFLENAGLRVLRLFPSLSFLFASFAPLRFSFFLFVLIIVNSWLRSLGALAVHFSSLFSCHCYCHCPWRTRRTRRKTNPRCRRIFRRYDDCSPKLPGSPSISWRDSLSWAA